MSLPVLAVLIRHEGGGAERSVQRLVEPCRRRNVSLLPVALDPPQPGETRPAGPVLGDGNGTSARSVLLAAWRLRQEIRRQRPAVVHLHCERPELVGALTLLLLRRRPRVVVTEHNMVQWRSAPTVGRAVRALLARQGAVLVSCHGRPDAGRTVIHNPTETEVVPVGHAADGSTRRLLLLSRLTGAKRIDLVLRAAAAAGWTAPIVVVGDGPEQPALERLSHELGLSVTFHGYAAAPWALSRPGDVLVSASSHEGEPLAVVEAVARDLPVLLSDIPAHRALLDTAVPMFADPHELECALRRLHHDGSRWLTVPTRTRMAILHERRPDVVAVAWATLYQQLVAGAR